MGLRAWRDAARWTVTCGLGLELVVLVASAVAQEAMEPNLVSARMVADFTADDGSAVVRMEYVLEGGRPGASIPVQLLGFDVATADEMNVNGQGPVVLWPASGTLRVATILAPVATTGATFPLSLEYRIERAAEVDGGGVLRARLPVLVLRLAASASGGEERFQASVRLPQSWTVTESFPTGLHGGDGAEYEVSLAVVPSVLRFRGRTDGTWRPGFPLLVDLFIGVFLLGVGFLGWRHLRSMAT